MDPYSPQAIAQKSGIVKTPAQLASNFVAPRKSRYEEFKKIANVEMEKARKENSVVGKVKNFFRAIPKETLNVAKDIAQGTARSGGMLGLTAYNTFGAPFSDVGSGKLTKGGKIEVLPPSKISKIVFGDKPLLPIDKAIKKTEKDVEPYIGKTGSKFVSAPLVLGSIFLDFTGSGGSAKTVKALATANKASDVASILKKAGVADDVISNFAETIAKTTDEKAVAGILNKISTLQKGASVSDNVVSKQISEVDNLIAQNKIRVVSRNNTDIYQYKKGGQWVNARDSDSAVKQVTPKPSIPKTQIELPKELEEKKILQSIKEENLANNPARKLQKFMSTRGDYKGELKEVTGVGSKFSKKGDDIVKELGFEDSESAREAFNVYKREKESLAKLTADIKMQEKAFKQTVKQSDNVVKQATPTLEKPKDIPLIAKSEGEVRSIERQAEELLSKSDSSGVGKISSLPKIIEQAQTNVKQKINLLDYVRTPDRVLEKIGFKKEGELLREGYDNYVKELPKNIDKITEWSKQVPKESNKRIFRYLDGEAIDLNPVEKKVAMEIKDWLADWAKRLKLPTDNTITNYITHIFDKELLAKEFDEDLAKIIGEKLPGSVYNPFLLKRLGAKGYIQDTWQALDAYVKRGTRKFHIDPALNAIKEKAGSSLEMSNIEASQFKFLQRYINNVNMRPTDLDNLIDNTIKSAIGYKYGDRPVTYLTKLLRQMTFRGMLGLNPGSALRNLSQGVNTFSVLGPKYTTIGYAKLFNRGAVKELTEEGVLNSGFIQDRALSSTKKLMENVDKGLFALFDTAEKINRGSAYFGAKSKAIARGMSEADAIKYAKEIVRKTQFSFGSVDTPVALQSDIVKTLTQFQTYTIKQIEFLTEMAKDKNFMGLLRYGIAGLVFTYTIGKAFGMKPEQLIPSFRFDTPPSLKFPVEVTKAVLNAPDKFGNQPDLKQKLKNVGNAGLGLIPGGSQIKKSVEGLKSVDEGGVFTPSGALKFEQGQTKAEKVQSILFGRYASEEAQNYFNKGDVKEKEQKPIKKIYDQVQALKEAGKMEEAQKIVDGLSDASYEIYKDVRTAEKAKATIQGKKDLLPIYHQIQELKNTNPKEAQKIVDGFTDDEYRYYTLLKESFEKAKTGQKPTFEEGDPEPVQSLIETAIVYAKAIGTDPVTAFDRIFTGQRIRYVTNGAVVVERLSLKDSQAIKDARGGKNENFKLDHLVPLQLGGSNAEDNLVLVPTSKWASYTVVENYLGKLLREKKISKKEAQSLIIKFKSGEISAEDIKSMQ